MSSLDKLPGQRFTEQCNNLLAACGEMTDNKPLIQAARRLRNSAAACDAANEVFEQAAHDVQALLMEQLS